MADNSFVGETGLLQLKEILEEKMLAIEGFQSLTTVFNSDGSITETNSKGDTLKTVFNSNGTITETLKTSSKTITKTTTFLSNGNIKEVIN